MADALDPTAQAVADFCPGASLARMELRTGLEAFLERAPGYRVEHEGVVRLPSDTSRGYARLPLRI